MATSQFARAAATAGPIDVGTEGVATRTQAYVLPRLVGGMDIILGESWLLPKKSLLTMRPCAHQFPGQMGHVFRLSPCMHAMGSHSAHARWQEIGGSELSAKRAPSSLHKAVNHFWCSCALLWVRLLFWLMQTAQLLHTRFWALRQSSTLLQI